MIFQGSGIDFQLENRSKIDEKNTIQDGMPQFMSIFLRKSSPRRPQDAPRRLKTRPRRLKTPPNTFQDAQRRGQDAPRRP